MREDNAVPIIILDVIEDALAILLAEVILSRIEYLGIGISLAKSVGNIEYICFESNNHRFVSQSQPLHLVGCCTHDKRLTCTDLVVADTTSIGLQHPHGIFLTLIKVLYAQYFKVEVGKRLMRTVEVGTHKAVKKAVVTVRELLLERVGCPSEPIYKALSDFLNLGICHLYGMTVTNLNRLLITLRIKYGLAFVNVRNGIVKCVLQ